MVAVLVCLEDSHRCLCVGILDFFIKTVAADDLVSESAVAIAWPSTYIKFSLWPRVATGETDEVVWVLTRDDESVGVTVWTLALW